MRKATAWLLDTTTACCLLIALVTSSWRWLLCALALAALRFIHGFVIGWHEHR